MNHTMIKVKRLTTTAKLPSKATPGSAGYDLHADVQDAVCIEPGTAWPVPTGIALELPAGWEAQVRPRSGLAIKGIMVANSPGTIDSDYRGEVKVIISVKPGGPCFYVNSGDRIAQLVFKQVPDVALVETAEDLSETARGRGGFGSTGTR